MLFGEVKEPLPFRQYQLEDVRQVGKKVLRTEVVSATTLAGWEQYSDLLLLACIAVNSLCGALILLLHSVSSVGQSFAISRWLIGGLDAVDYRVFGVFAGMVAVAAMVIVRRARHWNLLRKKTMYFF